SDSISKPRSKLDLPPLAKERTHQLVGRLVVGGFALDVIPQQLTFAAHGNRTEHEPFGIWPGNPEVGATGCAAFARTHPVAEMHSVIAAGARPGRDRQVFRRK